MNDSFDKIYKCLDWYFFLFSTKVFLCWCIGFLLWVYTYVKIIQNAKRYGKVEIPTLIIPLNIAWEFAWSITLIGPLGILHKIGSSIWLILDIYIAYCSLKLFLKNHSYSFLKKYSFKYFLLLLVGLLFVWMMRVYCNDDLGLLSGYTLNLLMSVLYISQLYISKYKCASVKSKAISWAKAFGTLSMSLGIYLYYNGINFILFVFCISTLILDLWYILLIYLSDNIETNESILADSLKSPDVILQLVKQSDTK